MENKKAIEKFLSELESEGKSDKRITKCKNVLSNFSKWLGKDFIKAEEEEIRKVIGKHIENSDYAEWTKKDYKAIVKQFYKRLEGEGEFYPKKVRWIKTTMKRNKQTLPDILTVEEVVKMIKTTNNIRNKAMISLLYESGCRISELLNMKISDIEFNGEGCLVRLRGKTGERRIPIVNSEEHIRNWMNNHSSPENPDSLLWGIQGNRFRDMLIRVGRRAGIKKRIYPHLFRHSRASELARVLTEAEMKIYFGWTGRSEMPSVYVHLSARDLTSAVLTKVHRIKEAEEDNENHKFRFKECPRCRKRNPPDSKFCNCGRVLDTKIAMELEKKEKGINRLMDMSDRDLEKLSDLIQSVRNLKR